MKIALIADIHAGCRNDSKIMLDQYEAFFEETFFPVLHREGINTIINVGDTFDRRKYTNHGTLHRFLGFYYNNLKRNNIHEYNIIGNHDCFYRNTLTPNSPSLYLGDYRDIVTIIDKPTEMSLGGVSFLLVPWICQNNQEACMRFLETSRAQFCAGHFEIQGFTMNKGTVCEHGTSREIFEKFEMTFSGHFHHRSTDGNIFYLGNPFETTWADYNDPKGFHIFDTQTKHLTFIQNPNKMFYKVHYNDDHWSLEDVMAMDFSDFKNTYVKIIVEHKGNPYLFENYINQLAAAEPADVSVVENFIEVTEGAEMELDQAQDTPTIINKFIDNLNLGSLDPARMKALMNEMYLETFMTMDDE